MLYIWTIVGEWQKVFCLTRLARESLQVMPLSGFYSWGKPRLKWPLPRILDRGVAHGASYVRAQWLYDLHIPQRHSAQGCKEWSFGVECRDSSDIFRSLLTYIHHRCRFIGPWYVSQSRFQLRLWTVWIFQTLRPFVLGNTRRTSTSCHRWRWRNRALLNELTDIGPHMSDEQFWEYSGRTLNCLLEGVCGVVFLHTGLTEV